MSGVPIARAKFVAYTLSGLLAAIGGLFLTFFTYSGEASLANGGTYTLFSIAAVVLGGVSLFGGSGSAIGAIFGALAFRTIGDLLFVFDIEPLWQPLFQGVVLLLAVSLGSAAALPDPQPPRSVRMSDGDDDQAPVAPAACPRSSAASIRRWRPPSPASSLLLFLGSLYSPNFLSPEYLLQQLKVASFLGVIATGMMLVILLGQIDLSVPWVVAIGGMMACGGDRLRAARRGAGDPLRHPLRRRCSASSTASASPISASPR